MYKYILQIKSKTNLFALILDINLHVILIYIALNLHTKNSIKARVFCYTFEQENNIITQSRKVDSQLQKADLNK